MRTPLVIDASAEHIVLWSEGLGIASHPSLVAVDERGAVRAHGAAALHAKRTDDRLALRRPFAGGDVVDPRLARSLLARLLSGLGGSTRKSAILFPLPTSTPGDVTTHWQDLAISVGGRPLFADRPTAVALGLGVESEGAHMLIEVTPDFIEIGIISGGSLIAERTIRGAPSSWAAVDVVGAMLGDIDPDDELDIRDEGLHLVAPDEDSSGLARQLADGLGVPVLLTGAACHPVVLGARQIVAVGL